MGRLTDYLTLMQLISATTDVAPIIESISGDIRGVMIKEFGTTYYGYRGIPYAEPPTGANRFMPPIPKKAWRGQFDATEYGAVCPQPQRAYTRSQMSEDCLNLNVYIPGDVDYSEPLPVLVFVHGGEFLSLSGRSDYVYGPQFFMKYGVILVIFNYRLGAPGFLSVETQEAAGNAALKDILLVLKWVKAHIGQFGGHPNNITLGGNSAGAALVHYMLLTEQTTGLISKAILISGSALSSRFFSRHPMDNAFALGDQLGCNARNTTELMQCLRRVDVFDIVNATTAMGVNDDSQALKPFVPFTPVAEPTSDHAIITKDPIEIIQSGIPQNVPIIAGFNSEEGLRMLPTIRDSPAYVDKVNRNFELSIPSNIEYPFGSRKSRNLANDIKRFYFDGGDISNASLQGFVDLVSDVQFTYSIDSWIWIHKTFSQGNLLYYYVFDFDGDLSWFKINRKITFKGASHADELGYLFITRDTRPLLATASYETNKTMSVLMSLFTNFCKYGSPTPDTVSTIHCSTRWLDCGPARSFLYIDDHPHMSQGAPLQHRLQFWYKVYLEHDWYVKNGGVLEPKVVP